MNFNFNLVYKSFVNPFNQYLGSLFLINQSNQPTNIVRTYHRRRFIRRYGYAPRYHTKGLLPRIKDEVFPIRSLPYEKKPDPWRPSVAMFGQNDYIDILGDDRVHPTDTMSSIPTWLRKFKGNEMQMLIRRRKEKAHWSWFRPHKWHLLNKRIDFLYKRLNYKKPAPKPEYPAGY